ncbi:MAG TPA: iron chelate uptake ABC transporter family permease subunit [Cellvibrionaceae bacterium]|nr:iron chelate uptake ABC transporter family permease subunit [Cellvibrionaceae bacterium]HNG60099.1 iron chelate uptake ABC transporter family permease subunit [Cellvibrionaceae bacterium]
MPDFLLNALLAGSALALISGPLGSFVVWRRMAYFGDTLAHASLLGVALGLFLQINPWVAVMVGSALLGALLMLLQQQKNLASDTLLGILSHGALAAGLVCVSLMANPQLDLFSFLLGDLLTATRAEALSMAGLSLLLLAVLKLAWRPWLCMALDEDLARAEGLQVDAWQLLFMVMLALVIALAMKVVGVLLITALLIIPAAAARQFCQSPTAMAAGAALIGVLAVNGGLAASFFWDTPAGPSAVLVAVLVFMLGWLRRRAD